jgi:hypothetical protein
MPEICVATGLQTQTCTLLFIFERKIRGLLRELIRSSRCSTLVHTLPQILHVLKWYQI